MLPPVRQLSNCNWPLVFTILWLLSLRLHSDLTSSSSAQKQKAGGHQSAAMTETWRRSRRRLPHVLQTTCDFQRRDLCQPSGDGGAKRKKKKNRVAAATLNNERLHAVADSDGKPREEFRASHPARFIILSQSIKVRLCCLSTRNRSSA